MRQLPIPLLILVILLALLAIVGSLWTVPRPENANGVAHDEFSSMRSGGEGLSRLEPVLGRGWLVGALEISLFVALMALGLRRGRGLPKGAWQLLVGLALCVVVFSLVVRTYLSYAESPLEGPLVLGFPVPTTWMLYGLWTVPAVFLLLYIARFDRWIFSAEDEREFKKLVERSQKAHETPASHGATEEGAG